MNLRSVDLNLLPLFDALMTEQNMTRAAEKIGMSQPAMSRALGRMRGMMNDELFISTGRGLKPTPRAIQISDSVRRLLDLVSGLLTPDSDFDYVNSDREFNLVFSDYGEVVLLGRILQWMRKLGSSVRINMRSHTSGDLKEALHFGEIDMCLWAIPIPDQDIHNERVFTETYCSLVRRGHPVISNGLDLAQYLSLDHVLAWYPDPQGHYIDRALRANGHERRKMMEVHTSLDMPHIVASTDMICSMPSAMAKYFAELHDLLLFRTPVPDVELPGFLMWHNRSEQDPGHKWLRQFIIDLCRRL